MRVAIIGAGNSGLAMAAHMSFTDNKVYLWNRSEDNITDLMRTRKVETTGVLVGEFELEMVTTKMEEVLSCAKVVLVTTPATSHQGLAKIMAPYLTDEHIVILNPGR
ncbi:MAG: NADP transhydrogenase subunit alpha, partial [Clostridia bacterium]|nr:NADP transhydrogenase subunit alpha [Clostridia bacterium]